ncbi:MAG: peptidylprolyl isomerase [Cyanobacteria bacterium P01_H01_bin.15]
MALGLKIEKLKTVLTESKLEYYFKENQNSLSQYSLHRLMTADKELAEKLSQELQAEKTVEELAKEYGESDPPVRIFKQQVQQRSLPKTLQNSFDSATSGTVVGPVEIDKSWSVFSVIDIIPAELDEKTKKQIEAQLFSEWLVQQVQDLKIDFRSNTADVSTSK